MERRLKKYDEIEALEHKFKRQKDPNNTLQYLEDNRNKSRSIKEYFCDTEKSLKDFTNLH